MEPVAAGASHLFRSSALAFPSSLESVPWEMVLTEIEEFNTSLTSFLSSGALSRSSRSCRCSPALHPAPDAWVKEEGWCGASANLENTVTQAHFAAAVSNSAVRACH